MKIIYLNMIQKVIILLINAILFLLKIELIFLLNDRKNEFINNNWSLCENNYTYDEYDSETKQVLCKS